MFGLGPTELIVILVIILVLFGGTQLPKLAKSIREARKELTAAVQRIEHFLDAQRVGLRVAADAVGGRDDRDGDGHVRLSG